MELGALPRRGVPATTGVLAAEHTDRVQGAAVQAPGHVRSYVRRVSERPATGRYGSIGSAFTTLLAASVSCSRT